MRRENGITLIALIITIIILVILAAVSINAVANMGIVGHAINGSQEYAQKAKEENEMLGDTTNLIDNALSKLNDIQDSTPSSSLLTFTWGGLNDHSTLMECSFLPGMTWEEWIDSDLNPYYGTENTFTPYCIPGDGRVSYNGWMIDYDEDGLDDYSAEPMDFSGNNFSYQNANDEIKQGYYWANGD